MKIIPYEPRYRDDMIFMVLQAKDALGRVPRLNPDLLDPEESYLKKGDGFLLALDDGDRVIGCAGYTKTAGASEAVLHRLYVKASMKRRGIGSALLRAVETELREKGIAVAKVHLGDPEIYFESYRFYPKHGYRTYEPARMMKIL